MSLNKFKFNVQNTVFGYIFGGSIPDSMHCGLLCNAEEEFKKVFDHESIGIRDYPYSNDEDNALKIFSETVSFTGQKYKFMVQWKRD